MGYITENRLSDIIDIPIALPATQLLMGDWLVIATVKIAAPMRLTCRMLNFQLVSSAVDVTTIAADNHVNGNLGLAYVVLRKNYISGSPGAAGGLDTLMASNVGLYTRDITTPVVITDPGTYSWIVANNMQASSDQTDLISPSTSIDFIVAATGSARLELSYT